MRFRKKVISLLGSLVLMGLLAACGETEVKEVSNTDKKDEKQELEKVEIPNKPFKVGDIVSVNGLEITITSAKYSERENYYT